MEYLTDLSIETKYGKAYVDFVNYRITLLRKIRKDVRHDTYIGNCNVVSL